MFERTRYQFGWLRKKPVDWGLMCGYGSIVQRGLMGSRRKML
jgi:hypothetical protein